MRSAREVQVRTVSAVALVAIAGCGLALTNAAAEDAADGLPNPSQCAALGFKLPLQRDTAVPGGANIGTFAASPIAKSAPSTVQRGIAAPPPYVSEAARRQDTEEYPNATPNPIKRVTEAPVSTFSIDVDTASYANVRRFLGEGKLPPRDAVRVEEMINYFDYGYATPASRDTPFLTMIAVTASPWHPTRQIVHIGLKAFEPPKAELPPLNLVFLVDTSGSMFSVDRLPLAQKSLNVLIDQLRPQDHVSLVAYAGSAGAVLGPTDGRQKLKIRCAVDALTAGGSTAGGQGLSLAYKLAEQNFDGKAVNRVVLMTDGDFNVGISDPAKLKDFVSEKRKSGVYLSVYGYGRGNYNDTMMQALAQNGNGTASYVDSLEEARKIFRDDFAGAMFPVANDVKIQVEFNPNRVSEYRLIGYETRTLNREDFNNDAVDAGEVGAGSAVTALYEITPAGTPLASDPLRYQNGEAPIVRTSDGELAFVKIRYKLPGGTESRLIERPITELDRPATPSEGTRWAMAVAAYGQKLRGDSYVTSDFGWDKVIDLAQSARGTDPLGIRAQFVQLARAAQSAKSVND